MAIRCFAIARALGATARNVARRFIEHKTHHAHHLMRSALSLHTGKLPAVVCVATAVATGGIGGVVAGAQLFGSKSWGTTNTPLPLGVSLPESLLPSLIASFPGAIGGGADTPWPNDWLEAGNPWNTAAIFPWNEAYYVRDIPGLSFPEAVNSTSDTPSRSAAVPEPSSISILGASLLGIGVLRRRRSPEPGKLRGDGLLIGDLAVQDANVAGKPGHAGDKAG